MQTAGSASWQRSWPTCIKQKLTRAAKPSHEVVVLTLFSSIPCSVCRYKEVSTSTDAYNPGMRIEPKSPGPIMAGFGTFFYSKDMLDGKTPRSRRTGTPRVRDCGMHHAHPRKPSTSLGLLWLQWGRGPGHEVEVEVCSVLLASSVDGTRTGMEMETGLLGRSGTGLTGIAGAPRGKPQKGRLWRGEGRHGRGTYL